ncbi:hypothetical protein [Burkholderia sp. 22313]|uniref:hypothetical protein n=1 Tax=Burkholderia sp. 22313 TaxID=3453908 RepID=UPI003F87BF71
MKEAEKCGIARAAIDAEATIAGKSTGRAGFSPSRGRRKIGKPVVHANGKAKPNSNPDGASDADATTAEAAVPAYRAGARMRAAGRLATTGAYRCVSDPERAAPAALRAPIRRSALLIQPYSLFCIVLVGELPTDFPDRAVGES